jgi:dienelactone hydrolase
MRCISAWPHRVNMDILIATDIFGHTPALDRLANQLANRLAGQQTGTTIEIMDPYDGQVCFRDEPAAYSFFSSQTGITAYSEKISNRLKSNHLKPGHLKMGRPTHTLIGFSVGAAAIWHLSADPKFAGIQRAVGFYGSQIRHHPEILPVFDTRLIWPRSEPHFDVDHLMFILKDTPKISCCKADGLHGFMNELSQNYDENLTEACLEKLNPKRKPE